MSTIFIAVQCCQCSTMQMKQRKKSSNKWTCVVCNQKQSVLKVFSQALMAKHVRKFVQTFNGSRQLADQNQLLGEGQQTLGSPSDEIETGHEFQENQKKKRTDWTEYIDAENEEDEQTSGDVFEPMIVTELPKVLFKKPKLSHYSSSSTELDSGKSNEKAFRPVSGKRNSYKQLNSLEKEPSKPEVPLMNLKQDDCKRLSVDIFSNRELTRNRPSNDKGKLHIFARKELMRPQTALKGASSKWNDYLTKDNDDDSKNQHGKGLGNHPMDSQNGNTMQAGNIFANQELTRHRPSKEKGTLPDAVAIFAGKELTRPQTALKGTSSKWNDYLTKDDDDDDDIKNQSWKRLGNHLMGHQNVNTMQAGNILANPELIRHQPSKEKGTLPDAVTIFAAKELTRPQQTVNSATSKWNDYLTEDDDDNDLKIKSGKDFETHHTDQWNHAAFQTTLNYQTVEDDIHPDFL